MRLSVLGGIVAISISALILQGCTASSSVQRNAPSSAKVINTITVNEPFEVVWDRMIKNLSSRLFVINNVEKTSRIMNVSFSADEPTNYVDCGTSTRTYNPPIGAVRTYNYRNADKTITFLMAAPNGQPATLFATRSLEGRANIYVAPNADAAKTDISVNVRYIITVNSEAYAIDGYGNAVGAPYKAPTETWSFDTAESKVVSSGEDGQISCASRGVLEEQVLATARAQ